MNTFRSIRFALPSALLVIGASSWLAGCGGDDDKRVVAVDPQFQTKTNDMLKQMKADAIEKSRKLTRRRR